MKTRGSAGGTSKPRAPRAPRRSSSSAAPGDDEVAVRSRAPAMSPKERKVVAQRLAKIAEAGGGEITPEDVVRDARSAKSPLHQFFEWDDSTAAHRWRLVIARQVLRLIVVEVATTEFVVSVPMYVHNPDRSNDDGGYITIAHAKSKETSRRAVLYTEIVRARSSLARAEAVGGALGFDTSRLGTMREELDQFSVEHGLLQRDAG